MKRAKQTNDLKKWHENFLGFLVSLLILLMLIFSYDEGVFKEGIGTSSKVMHRLFQYLDSEFGKEYVFGFIVLVMIIFGIAALLGYSKEEKSKKKGR